MNPLLKAFGRFCVRLGLPVFWAVAWITTVSIGQAAAIPWTNGQAAELTLGTSAGGGPTDFSGPTDVAIDAVHGKLYVADNGNNRVLRFPYPVTAGSLAAEAVFGQENFTSYSPNRGDASPSNITMSGPCGVAVAANGDLWVAESQNHRVIKIPSAYSAVNGAAATVVLGQPDMNTVVSAGGSCSRSTFSLPSDLGIDSTGTLWVADLGNNRVLRFDNVAGKTSGLVNADGVLGQADFVAKGVNGGAATAAANVMSAPYRIGVFGTTLWVADYNNNRVLRFDNAADKEVGDNADGVLGQANFTSAQANYVGSVAANTLSAPYGVAADAAGALYVSDFGNSRILIFSAAASKSPGAAADNYLEAGSFTSVGALQASSLAYEDGLHRLEVVAASQINQYFNYSFTTTTALTSSQNHSPISGATVTFTATVTTAAGGDMATGTVNFREGSTILGTGTLDGSGVATFATGSLSDGNHLIVAEYMQDSLHKGSTSSALSQVIGLATPLSAIANVYGDDAAFTSGASAGNAVYVGGAGSDGHPDSMQSALKFDLGSAVSGIIISATLKLRVCDVTDPHTLSVDVYGSVNDGWYDAPSASGPATKNTPAIGSFATAGLLAGQWVSIPVTDFVKAQYSGDGVVTFVLDSTVSGEINDYIGFYSREVGAQYAPVLEIQSLAVMGIEPASGTSAGGTAVTIIGTNLTGATAVTIGGKAVTSFSVVDATTITAVTPDGAVGAQDVVVTTPVGTVTATGLYTYFIPTTVSSVTGPGNDWYFVGQNLDFTVNFSQAVNVVTTGGTPYLTLTVGGVSRHASYVSGSGTSALVFRYTIVPGDLDADGIGLDANITANGGTIKDASANAATLDSAAASFAGVQVDAVAPSVTGISPVNGSVTGGTSVTITGSHLASATAVKFGTTSASITANTNTSIVATAPSVGSTGAVDVTVTTANGVSATSASDLFTYAIPPALRPS